MLPHRSHAARELYYPNTCPGMKRLIRLTIALTMLLAAPAARSQYIVEASDLIPMPVPEDTVHAAAGALRPTTIRVVCPFAGVNFKGTTGQIGETVWDPDCKEYRIRISPDSRLIQINVPGPCKPVFYDLKPQVERFPVVDGFKRLTPGGVYRIDLTLPDPLVQYLINAAGK